MSSDDRGFKIEVTIAAPLDVVWRALTDPAELRRWFGWDYEGLDGDIRYMLVEHVIRVPPDRISDDDNGWTIELVTDGPRTIVRLVGPGPLADAHWDDIYDDEVQGWHQFLVQLRNYLERHPGKERRTLYLEGSAVPAAVRAIIGEELTAQTWYSGRHQLVIAADDYGGSLLVVVASLGLDADRASAMHVTLSTHGLDDEQFAEVDRTWRARWTAVADDAKVTP